MQGTKEGTTKNTMLECPWANKLRKKVENRCTKRTSQWKQHIPDEFYRNMAKERNSRWQDSRIHNIPERIDKIESSEKEADKPVNGKPRPKKRTFEKTDDNDGESENHTDAENVEEVTFHISPRPSTRVIKRLQRPPRRPMITWSPCPERFTFLIYSYIGQFVRFVKIYQNSTFVNYH